MADSSGKRWQEQRYVELYPDYHRTYAMSYNGELHTYNNGGFVSSTEGQRRFAALRTGLHSRTGFWVYNQQEKTFISSAVYDSVNLLNDSLLIVYQEELMGVFHSVKDSFLAHPGQYPIAQVNHARKQVGFGYDSSSCIYGFNGEQISHWESMELVKPFKDIGYFVVLDTFSIGLRSRGQPKKWLVAPKYCAIADYDPSTGRASVRDCPIAPFEEAAYWNQGRVPTAGNWGVVDAEGNWLVEPLSEVPIDLYQERFLMQSGSARCMYKANGEAIWPDWYAEVSKLDSMGNHYWVTKASGLRGVISREGAHRIPVVYHYLVPDSQGVYAVYFPDSLPNAQVWYYNSEWKREKVEGLEKLKVLARGMDQESLGDLEVPVLIKEKDWKTAYETWYYETWIKAHAPDLDAESYHEIPYPGPFTNQGFCHPAFRLPYSIQQLPQYRGTYKYTQLIDTQHRFGVSLTVENRGGYSYRNTSQLYFGYRFVNLAWVNGALKELKFWDFIDPSCKESLNQALLQKLEQAGLDTYCAKDGMMLEVLADNFVIQEEHLVFVVSPADNFGQYSLDAYRRISFRLEDWPLTPTFEAKR